MFLRPIILIPTSEDFVLYIMYAHHNISEIPRGFSKDLKEMMLKFL